MTPKNPKILCVHQGYELYGSDKMFVQTVRAIKKKWPTAQVTAHIPQDGALKAVLDDIADDVQIGGVWVLRRSNLRVQNWRKIPSVFTDCFNAWKQMRQYDLVYINTMMVLSHILVNRASRVPSLTHIHENSGGLTGVVLNLLALIGGGDFITNATMTHTSYKTIFGFRKHLVLNGVAGPKEAPKPPTKKKTLNLLHVGRFNDFKGQDVLIEAISRLPKDYRERLNVRLIGSVFGQQDFYLKRLETLISELNASKQIEIMPFMDNLSAQYKWADCVVLCSKSKKETFGLTVIEGMAHARPAIVSNIGGLPELVTSGQNGLVVKPNDIWSLRDAIIHYLDYPEEIKAHGLQAFKVYKKYFSVAKYNKNIVKIFKMILSGSRQSTVRHIYTDLLRKTGKNYDPDPGVSDTVLIGSLVTRAIWIMRGFIRFQKKVFVAAGVGLRGKNGITIGEFSTIERAVKIDGVAKNGVRIGKRVRIGAFTEISCTSHFSKLGQGLEIGDDSGIGAYSFIGASGGVKIGSNVIMGQYVTFHAQDHVFDDPDQPIKDQGVTEKGIKIGDDCWVGAKVTFLDGATVGNHCVVAAGAVVKGDFPDNSMIGGVPAKILKKI